jgi:hypothetical protein
MAGEFNSTKIRCRERNADGPKQRFSDFINEPIKARRVSYYCSMHKITALLAALLCVAIPSFAQQPLYDSLELAKRRIQKIVILSDYKDDDSSSVRVFDTLQVAQLARFQMYPLAPVANLLPPDLSTYTNGEILGVEDSTNAKSDMIRVLNYTSLKMIKVVLTKNIYKDSIPTINIYTPFLPADSIIYQYNDQQRLTEKLVYCKHKLITRETYTYSRNGLPETSTVYDPQFLLSPEGTCVRKYVYLK